MSETSTPGQVLAAEMASVEMRSCSFLGRDGKAGLSKCNFVPLPSLSISGLILMQLPQLPYHCSINNIRSAYYSLKIYKRPTHITPPSQFSCLSSTSDQTLITKSLPISLHLRTPLSLRCLQLGPSCHKGTFAHSWTSAVSALQMFGAKAITLQESNFWTT